MGWITKNGVHIWIEESNLADALREKYHSDYIPSCFIYSREKDENLNDIFIEIDKKFLKSGYEYIGIADTKNGKKLCDITTSYSQKGVDPSSKMKELIKKSKENTLTLIHNHPKATTFSSTDIITLNKFNSIKESIVINSNGESYYLYIPKNAKMKLSKNNIELFKKDYQRMTKDLKKVKHLTNAEAKHQALKKISKERGWKYGRKKV